MALEMGGTSSMENQKRGWREGGGPPRRSVQSNPALPVHPISSFRHRLIRKKGFGDGGRERSV